MVPRLVSTVAVYRLDGSMPISGSDENWRVCGDEPSAAGKGWGMAATLSTPTAALPRFTPVREPLT
jgi:hypothetical protein